jgi:hypothetical protein
MGGNGADAGQRDREITVTNRDRLAKPHEIAHLAAFLASPENTYIVGQIIFAGGGSEVIRRGDAFQIGISWLEHTSVRPREFRSMQCGDRLGHMASSLAIRRAVA